MKFAFVIHPTSFEDVVRYEPGALGKGPALIEKIMEWMPAYTAAHATGIRTPDGRETEGWFVAANYMPEQMLRLERERVYAKISRAIEIGAELGAEVCGLGAFSGVVGDAGRTLASRAPIAVTTGNSLTIATGVRSLLRGAAEMGIETREQTAVVIGATGSIGSACVELLAPHVAELILVATNLTRLRALHERRRERFSCRSSITTDLRAAVRRARLVLTATTATRELIEPEDLQAGAVVCELSLPHDVGPRVARERPDVLVVEGGILRVPGSFALERVREPGQPFDLGLPPQTALACMSETMVLALEERREHFTLGRGIELGKVREIEALARKAGFSLAEMRAFGRTLGPDDLERTRAAAERRSAAAV
ncbi:MAG: shikimate dehydrogenase [Vulcanimicrobiaceae bacterium]